MRLIADLTLVSGCCASRWRTSALGESQKYMREYHYCVIALLPKAHVLSSADIRPMVTATFFRLLYVSPAGLL